MPENFLSMPDGAMRACQIRDGSNEPLYFFVSCKARIIWLTKFINSRVDGARAAVPHPDAYSVQAQKLNTFASSDEGDTGRMPYLTKVPSQSASLAAISPYKFIISSSANAIKGSPAK